MKKVFIDGGAGTTGLRIVERLADRKDIESFTLPEKFRKSPEARKEAINSSDAVFLCLPDDASREALTFVDNPDVVIIDASTAHRTETGWAYGFPELSHELEQKIINSKRIAVPGCHASGFIALVYPLVKHGIIKSSCLLTCHSLTGYSGGGKKMIAEYENKNSNALLDAPRQYGLTQQHKHLKEMKAMTCLDNYPLFCPIVSDFYSGMEVTVPIFSSQLSPSLTVNDIKELYAQIYKGPIVFYGSGCDEEGFLSSNALAGKDSMQISVYGNDERILLVARYDNLGKGASGAAIECLNLVFGCDRTQGLTL